MITAYLLHLVHFSRIHWSTEIHKMSPILKGAIITGFLTHLLRILIIFKKMHASKNTKIFEIISKQHPAYFPYCVFSHSRVLPVSHDPVPRRLPVSPDPVPCTKVVRVPWSSTTKVARVPWSSTAKEDAREGPDYFWPVSFRIPSFFAPRGVTNYSARGWTVAGLPSHTKQLWTALTYETAGTALRYETARTALTYETALDSPHIRNSSDSPHIRNSSLLDGAVHTKLLGTGRGWPNSLRNSSSAATAATTRGTNSRDSSAYIGHHSSVQPASQLSTAATTAHYSRNHNFEQPPSQLYTAVITDLHSRHHSSTQPSSQIYIAAIISTQPSSQ